MSDAMGAAQDGQVIVENSDKTESTGGGNGKQPQYTCPSKYRIELLLLHPVASPVVHQ